MRKVRRMKEEEKNRQPKGSFLKVGTARRAVPNLRREAPFPEQGRLRREIGTPAARHPYQFLSKGAAAPIWHMVPPVVSNTAPTTKPPGGGEEAHRRWPEGRSERGASKATRRPPAALSTTSFDSHAPARSPFGPTYGCSISCLPRHSIVSSVVNPSPSHFQLN